MSDLENFFDTKKTYPIWYIGPKNTKQYDINKAGSISLGILLFIIIIGLIVFKFSYKKYEDKDGKVYYNPQSKSSEWNGNYSIGKKSMRIYIIFFFVGIILIFVPFLINLIMIGQSRRLMSKTNKIFENLV